MSEPLDAIRVRREGTDIVLSLRYGGDSTLTDVLRFNLLEQGADHIYVLRDALDAAPEGLETARLTGARP